MARPPREVLLRLWPPNGTLAVEQLSLFIQALMGPPRLLNHAASEFLRYLTWPKRPENEQLASVAVALGYILASNGGKAGTITVARTDTGFDFEHRNTTTGNVLGVGIETGERLEDKAEARKARGGALGADDGVVAELPRVKSATVYIDVVNDHGEVERYVVQLEREDV
ncbi:hypothetical protein ACFQHN_26260 [Natrialbaceae archaeon GCM10025896]